MIKLLVRGFLCRISIFCYFYTHNNDYIIYIYTMMMMMMMQTFLVYDVVYYLC